MLDELVMQVKKRNGTIHVYDQPRVRPSILGKLSPLRREFFNC